MIKLTASASGGYRAHWVNGAYVGDIDKQDDGYYAWWPADAKGYLNEGFLRCLADILKSLNSKWDGVVKDQGKKDRVAKMHASVEVIGRNYKPSGDKSCPF